MELRRDLTATITYYEQLIHQSEINEKQESKVLESGKKTAIQAVDQAFTTFKVKNSKLHAQHRSNLRELGDDYLKGRPRSIRDYQQLVELANKLSDFKQRKKRTTEKHNQAIQESQEKFRVERERYHQQLQEVKERLARVEQEEEEALEQTIVEDLENSLRSISDSSASESLLETPRLEDFRLDRTGLDSVSVSDTETEYNSIEELLDSSQESIEVDRLEIDPELRLELNPFVRLEVDPVVENLLNPVADPIIDQIEVGPLVPEEDIEAEVEEGLLDEDELRELIGEPAPREMALQAGLKDIPKFTGENRELDIPDTHILEFGGALKIFPEVVYPPTNQAQATAVIRLFIYSLQKKARKWIENAFPDPEQRQTVEHWNTIKEAFLRKFNVHGDTPEQRLHAWKSMKWDGKIDIDDYVDKYRSLGQQLGYNEAQILMNFKHDMGVKYFLALNQCGTMHEAADQLKKITAMERIKKEEASSTTPDLPFMMGVDILDPFSQSEEAEEETLLALLERQARQGKSKNSRKSAHPMKGDIAMKLDEIQGNLESRVDGIESHLENLSTTIDNFAQSQN
ncbi:MAG: hypothetical protein MJA29_09115, partial [Candidatus Omnitrophica bacterium]|nr:hypothetical protein [Candidatus Omnitrophota bacterium]